MGDDILYFQSEIEKAWFKSEERIKNYLKSINASEEMSNYILPKMKEVFYSYEKNFGFDIALPTGDLPESKNDAILLAVQKGVNIQMEKISKFWYKVLHDRMLLEIELYKCQQRL